MPSADSHRRQVIALLPRRREAVAPRITRLRFTQAAVAVTAHSARTDCGISAEHARRPERVPCGGTAKGEALWRQLRLSGSRL